MHELPCMRELRRAARRSGQALNQVARSLVHAKVGVVSLLTLVCRFKVTRRELRRHWEYLCRRCDVAWPCRMMTCGRHAAVPVPFWDAFASQQSVCMRDLTEDLRWKHAKQIRHLVDLRLFHEAKRVSARYDPAWRPLSIERIWPVPFLFSTLERELFCVLLRRGFRDASTKWYRWKALVDTYAPPR